jgi:hypothetical protein
MATYIRSKPLSNARGWSATKDVKPWPRNPYWRGRLCTVELLVLTISDLLLFILKYLDYKTNYLNEEVYCTEPFPSVNVPCFDVI